jgi:hypothetical protein
MARRPVLIEPWFAPFALVNASAVGLVPILLPVVSSRYGVGHVGLVMGAFNLGAVGAPLTVSLAIFLARVARRASSPDTVHPRTPSPH